MTGDSLNPEQPPCGPLYASESDAGGASDTQRGSGAAPGAQAGAEGFEFDGCNSECRKAGEHTLRWGGCEHAPEPEPSITIMRVRTAADGYPELVGERSTVAELADRIEGVLRTVHIRLGPNALALLQRGETVGLSGGDYAAMAEAAAIAIAEDPDTQPRPANRINRKAPL